MGSIMGQSRQRILSRIYGRHTTNRRKWEQNRFYKNKSIQKDIQSEQANGKKHD